MVKVTIIYSFSKPTFRFHSCLHLLDTPWQTLQPSPFGIGITKSCPLLAHALVETQALPQLWVVVVLILGLW